MQLRVTNAEIKKIVLAHLKSEGRQIKEGTFRFIDGSPQSGAEVDIESDLDEPRRITKKSK